MRHKIKIFSASMYAIFPFYKRLGIILTVIFVVSATYFSQFAYANKMADTYVKQAKDHLNLFQYEKAKGLLSAAIKLDPQNWEVFYLVGKTLIKQKQIAKSEQYLVKANKLAPDNLDCQKALAGVYLMYAQRDKASGNTTSMLNNIHKSCKAYPQNTKIWANIMRLWQTNGSTNQIIANGDILLENNAKKLSQGDDKHLQEALTIVASTYFNKNQISEASRFAKKASMIRQTNDELYNLKRQIKDKSVTAANKLISEAKEKVALKEFGAAVRLLKEAQKIYPSKSGEIHTLISEAEKQFKLANLKRLVDSAVKNKRYKSALEILDNAYGLYPDVKSIEVRAASISATLEKREQELKAAKQKINSIKRKKEAWKKRYTQHLREGSRNYKEKKYAIAILSYQQALDMQPSNKKIIARIAELNKLVEQENRETVEFNSKLEEADDEYQNGKYAEAYDKYTSLANEHPDQKKTFAVNHALASLKLGHYDEARDIAVRFENDKSNSGAHNYINGVYNYEKGDHSASLEYFSKIEGSDSAKYNMTKIKFFIYLNKYKLGLFMVLGLLMFPLVRIFRQTVSSIKQKAMIKRIENIKANATYAENIGFLEERFEKEDAPDKKLIMAMYTDALYRSGKFERAFELGRNILKKDGRNAIIKRIVGECALAIKDTTTNSLDLIQNLYKIDESRKDVVTFLAQTFMAQQADHKQAQEFIVKYIQMATTEREPVLYLANVYLKRENYSRDSLLMLERAIKLAPEIVDYYVGYIANLKKLNLFDDVIRYTEEAKIKFPNEAHLFEDNASAPSIKSSGSYPDYDNIGQAQNNSNNPYPDYENIGLSPESAPTFSPEIKQDNVEVTTDSTIPAVLGKDQVACPHCKAPNSIREYYCSSCGKSLGG